MRPRPLALLPDRAITHTRVVRSARAKEKPANQLYNSTLSPLYLRRHLPIVFSLALLKLLIPHFYIIRKFDVVVLPLDITLIGSN